MDNLSGYANRPLRFVLRYLRRRLASHVVILASVVAAVACSVGTQYGVKYLVDGLSAGPARAGSVWLAFVFLISLIAADNFLWRIASWTASFTFVGVTGDLRRDIFRHLTGHAPSYFSDRLPGMLTSRITATSNAVFTVENMFVWNVLPPCIATFAAIAVGDKVGGAAGRWLRVVGVGWALLSAAHGVFSAVSDAQGLPTGNLSATDPRGLATFGLAGLWSIVLGLAIRSGTSFPRGLGIVALINGVDLLVLFLATATGIGTLVLGTGGLASVILGPLQWVWIGRAMIEA